MRFLDFELMLQWVDTPGDIGMEVNVFYMWDRSKFGRDRRWIMIRRIMVPKDNPPSPQNL